MNSALSKALPSSTTLANILTDVTLREGSQQDQDLRRASLVSKLSIVERLIATGIKRVELTAFAPGEWFTDADALVARASDLPSGIELRALYFNRKGLDRLMAAPRLLREGIFHTAATNNYREKNYRQTSDTELLSKLDDMLRGFAQYNLKFDTLVISTAWGEHGQSVDQNTLVEFLEKLSSHSAKGGFEPARITLADTVGAASPEQIASTFSAVKKSYPRCKLRAHLHPPLSRALDCVRAALDSGVDEWEAAWGGVGGSPFADRPGANLDIRVLIQAFAERGIPSGLREDAVPELLSILEENLQRKIPLLSWDIG